MSISTRKRILGILVLALAAGVILAVSALTRKGEGSGGTESPGTDRGFAMGSAVSVQLYGKAAENRSAEVIREISRLDEQVISWRAEASELAVWNRTAEAGAKTEVSRELGLAVEKSLELSKRSGGALDLTLRPVLDTWGVENGTPETFRVPSEEELKKAAERTDLAGQGKDAEKSGEDSAFSSSVLCEKGERDSYLLSRGRKELTLDLGAVGKGYALDAAYDLLRSDTEITGGVIAVGGSVLVYGEKADGGEFKVGIRDPEGLPEDILGVITFPSGTKKQCVSTSGGYEKVIEKDGVKYHHIIDPSTLHPAEGGLKSVTVVCGDGLLSDGLSTACFILGEEKAKELLKAYGAEGVLIRSDGSIYSTPGIEKQVELK